MAEPSAHAWQADQGGEPLSSLIVDTDIRGLNDDAFALHYLLASGVVPALVTTATGNTLASESAITARDMLSCYELAVEVPTAQGADAPHSWTPEVEQIHHITRSKLSGRQFLGRLGAQPAARAVPHESTEALSTLENFSDSIHGASYDYLALGPLSNLNDVLWHKKIPPSSIKHLVFSGGAFEVSGNVGAVAEFNVFADPHAASNVLHADIGRITVVPLDVTTEATYGLDEFQSIVRGPSIFAKLLSKAKLSQFEADPHYREPLWDLVAAVVYIHPEVVRRWERTSVAVEVGSSPWFGSTFIADKATATRRTAVWIVREIDQVMLSHLFVSAFSK